MKKFAIASGLLATLAMTMIGCGGDDGGSGVDRSKLVSEVTTAEAQDMCEYVTGQFNVEDFKKVACYFGAAFASGFDPSVSCEDRAQECLNTPSEEVDDLACVGGTQADIDALPPCATMVTLGKLEDCQVAMVRAISDFAEDVSCSNAIALIAIMPEECQEIMSICPELLDDDDEEEESL